ncbi:MAG: hypothetical protein QXX86_01345 [Sulfolobales archaeon]
MRILPYSGFSRTRTVSPHISVEVTGVHAVRLMSDTLKPTSSEVRSILVKLAIDLGKGT